MQKNIVEVAFVLQEDSKDNLDHQKNQRINFWKKGYCEKVHKNFLRLLSERIIKGKHIVEYNNYSIL